MFLLHHHSNTHAVHLLFTHNPGQDDQATHTHTFNGPFSRTTWVSRNQKSKTSLDFTEARDSEWQWHQLGHMQVCISLQTDNHASTPPLSFLQARCPSCHPTNSVKALKANYGQQQEITFETFSTVKCRDRLFLVVNYGQQQEINGLCI